jgi:hypothetical protein
VVNAVIDEGEKNTVRGLPLPKVLKNIINHLLLV